MVEASAQMGAALRPKELPVWTALGADKQSVVVQAHLDTKVSDVVKELRGMLRVHQSVIRHRNTVAGSGTGSRQGTMLPLTRQSLSSSQSSTSQRSSFN